MSENDQKFPDHLIRTSLFVFEVRIKVIESRLIAYRVCWVGENLLKCRSQEVMPDENGIAR